MIKFASISDIHIKKENDQGHKTLMNFFENELVKNADMVVFLGDIFDVMIGFNKTYLQRYHFFFKAIDELLKEGKQVHFFNGNHDFHLLKLFNHYFKNKQYDNFFYHETGLILNYGQNKIFLSHGDDEEIDNNGHRFFKKFIRWNISRWIAEQSWPMGLLDVMAQYLSNKSRESNFKNYTNDIIIGEKFKKTAEIVLEKLDVNIWVSGHSHFLDEYELSENKKYFNNGYPQSSKRFFYFDGEKGQLAYLRP